MPEIPELEAIRAYFNANVAGKTIAAVETRIPMVFRTPAAELQETLPGDAFASALRHGKFLLFYLASGRILAINPMLTGRFQYVAPATRLAAKTCLVIGVEGGRQLRYVDDRLMGKVYLVPAGGLANIPRWAENGPDLMDPDLTEEEWLRRLRKYRGQVKSILTNAEFVQGIGNAYSDEILWEARVHPFTPRTQLTEEELRRLFAAAGEVMTRATPLVAAAMVKNGDLDYEERRDFMQVHRRGGHPCPRCGADISEITANQRITSYCRACQGPSTRS